MLVADEVFGDVSVRKHEASVACHVDAGLKRPTGTVVCYVGVDRDHWTYHLWNRNQYC